MYKISIIGASGYAGIQLHNLLLNREDIEIIYSTSRSFKNEKISEIYKNLREITACDFSEKDIETIFDHSDLIFSALPHGILSSMVNFNRLKKAIVIDLGADFRIKDEESYKKWYQVDHKSFDLVKNSIYAIPEMNRDEIKNTRLIANPGCYPTATTLGLKPLLTSLSQWIETIYTDAKSGVTGAGRSLSIATHYTECNESMKAYNPGVHRHTPEIKENIGKLTNNVDIPFLFIPHLIPMNRGILATSYVKINAECLESLGNSKKDVLEKLHSYYNEAYKNEKFVRVLPLGEYPETRWVKGSNYCDIGISYDEDTSTIIVISAIDNLMKGAASQAIQNMNIILGLDEDKGINQIPLFPI